MIYLSGVHSEAWAIAAETQSFGLMLQPGNGYRLQLPRYRQYWAADNGCYSQGERFDAEKWLRWLETLGHQESCLFALAPDVPFDAAATLERSAPWLPRIRALGYSAAFAAQDGAEDISPPWDDFDVLFVGGSTKWKLSSSAWGVIAEARRRGKWTHMGRVNSWRRVQPADLMGCLSVDGTFLAFRNRKKGRGDPRARGVSEISSWLQELERAPFLPLRGENRT